MAALTHPLERLRLALQGQYEIERLLGQGGMGAVYLARDLTLDRPVAIKVISQEVAAGDELHERFLREARMVARLRHPNIVTVFSAGEADEQLYFVMELVPGESLREMIQREGQLDPPKVHRLLGELAMALQHAHEHGVIHRDVKPENILVDRETGRPMLTDFGIARALEKEGTLTNLGVLLGSPRYMSPEQATGDATIDGRSDLYALSLVGYEMLTGRAVVEAPSAAAMLVKHLNETPKPIAEVVPAVPPDLARAISVGLEKNRDQRWPSGRAMAEALGVSAVSVPSLTRPVRRTSRPTLVAAGIIAAVVATTAGALWWRGRDAPSLQSYVVMPFEVQSANADVKWLREGAVNMLTLSLSQWQDLAVTDYERTLDLVQGAGVAEGARVSLDAARNVARRANAGSLVMGQISTTADSLIVVASLFDARAGKQVNRVSRAAAIGADPRSIFDQMSRYLLDVAGGTSATTVDLAKATTTSLAAYRDYLDGLKALNGWKLNEADSLFALAVARDSTFALAHHKRAQTLSWSDPGGSLGPRSSELADALSDRLPLRERVLVRAHQLLTTGVRTGDSSGIRRLLMAEQLYDSLTSDPAAVAEAWYGLGDARYHLGDARIHAASGADDVQSPRLVNGALKAFRKALEIDPDYHLAYRHLVELYSHLGSHNLMVRGDTLVPASTTSDTAVRRVLRDSTHKLAVSIARDWLRADPDAVQPYSYLLNLYGFATPDSTVPLAREGIRRTGRQSVSLRVLLPVLDYFAGRPDAIRTDLDSALSQITVADLRRYASENERMPLMPVAVSVAAATGDSRLLAGTVDLLVRTDSVFPGTTDPTRRTMEASMLALRVAMGEQLSPETRRALFTGIRSLDATDTRSGFIRTLVGNFSYLAFLATRDTSMAGMAQRILGGTMSELDAARALAVGDTSKALQIASTFISPDSTKKVSLSVAGMRTFARADLMERLGNPAAAVGYYEALDPARFNVNCLVCPGMTLYVRSFFALGRLYEQLNEPAKALAAYEKFLSWWPVEDRVTATERTAAKAAINRLKDRARR